MYWIVKIQGCTFVSNMFVNEYSIFNIEIISVVCSLNSDSEDVPICFSMFQIQKFNQNIIRKVGHLSVLCI